MNGDIKPEDTGKSTKGWSLLVQWKDGSSSWEKLSDLKEGLPVQTAEYAENNKLSHFPSYKWWVPYVLKLRND